MSLLELIAVDKTPFLSTFPKAGSEAAYQTKIEIDKSYPCETCVWSECEYDNPFVKNIRVRLYYQVKKSLIMRENSGIWKPYTTPSFSKNYCFRVSEKIHASKLPLSLLVEAVEKAHAEWDLPSYWRHEKLISDFSSGGTA